MMTTLAHTRKQLPSFAMAYSLAAAVQLLGLQAAAQYAPQVPHGLFAAVATLLYFVTAASAARIADIVGWNSAALRWWGAQLGFGLAWTMLFFAGQYAAALPMALATAIMAAVATYRFWQTDRLAGLLMLPMLLWLAIAIHLNATLLTHV